MASTVTMRFNTAEVIRNLDRLKQRFPKASARASNRAAVTARAELARSVAEDVGTTVTAARDQLTIVNATATNPNAVIYAKTTRLKLIDLKARGPWPSRGRGRVRVGGKTYPNAFIAIVGSNRHKGVFTRGATSSRRSTGAWSANLPIKELKGPSIWQSAHKPEIQASARDKGIESLRKNLIHEIGWALSQGG